MRNREIRGEMMDSEYKQRKMRKMPIKREKTIQIFIIQGNFPKI